MAGVQFQDPAFVKNSGILPENPRLHRRVGQKMHIGAPGGNPLREPLVSLKYRNFSQILGAVMRKICLLCCFGLLVSCELFMTKEERARNLVNEELLSIDWNDVDQYPLVEVCDETAVK